MLVFIRSMKSIMRPSVSLFIGMVGRRKKEVANKKSEQITVYCTPDQRILLENNAHGESLSSFLLKAALRKKNVFEQVNPDVVKHTIQLQKVGNNLNQLTRIANSTREIPSENELMQTIFDLQKIISLVLTKLS